MSRWMLQIGIWAWCAAASAAAPELKHLYPAAGQRGTSSLVSIGKSDGWPRLWVSGSGVTFTPTPMLGTYNVEVAADAEPGPRLVRAVNAEGASAPRFFIVSPDPELRSIEPNDEFSSPQVLEKLPATISGRLDKGGDVDCYGVTLKKGETLVAWLEAYVLASTFDGLLRVTDQTGRVVAFNHDGRNLDPLLAWQAPEDGRFTVQVMGFAHPAQSSVQLTGGEGCVYRLHLSNRPVVRFTAPLMAKAGEKTPLHLLGWNLSAREVELDAGNSTPAAELTAPVPDAQWLRPIVVSEWRETLEQEPRDKDKAQTIELPSGVTGRIRSAGEEDRYTFNAVKGRAYELKVTAASAGSPLDAWLKVENPDGKEVARDDDSGSRDPSIRWTPQMDGTFTAVLGDVTHRGGDDFIYRLAIGEAVPAVTATVAAHAFSVKAGASAEIKATVKRSNGFSAKLELAVQEMPEGITAQHVEVPDKDGQVTLKLSADPAAKPTGQPIKLVLREKEGGREHPVQYQIASTGENNGVPQGYTELAINATDLLWLTVTPGDPAK